MIVNVAPQKVNGIVDQSEAVAIITCRSVQSTSMSAKRSFYCKSCRIGILNCINEQYCCNRCHKERKCARTTQVQRGNYYLETWVEYMMLKILLKILLKIMLKLEWIRLVLGLNGIDRWAMVAIITYPSLAAPNVNERVKAQQKLK